MKLSLRTKVIAAVLLMAVVVAGVAGLISYNVYSRSMEEHYERLTMNTARSAASMVDARAVAALAERTVEIYRSFCPDAHTPPDFDSFDEQDWADYYAAFDEIARSPAYDPTQKPDPDMTRSPEEREEGGLGIYIVRRLTGAATYYYSDGLNVLTLEKRW